ncbi:type-F conjugative transfer system pilin assembly protein TrbC [Pantoea sp. Acro-835]|uniref:Type-F conjugative transfer system pilin assembly protein TrbC n=2 Tax=Candidatus Pantoea multigeneris TaxID=2608357 RepID=A0ABX0RKI8_9GAMM|nr:type-F conjugative transfer system pilin assembly protein TrbC [Pantoea multigeneris]
MLIAAPLGAQAGDPPAASQVGQTENETAYFLSSSVPEKELAILMKAAQDRQIPVYFRGLVNDNMEVTAKFMMHMVTTYHLQGIQIDPVRFERYGVRQVPALVKKCGEHFDIVYGNVALGQALDMINQRGECRKAGNSTP